MISWVLRYVTRHSARSVAESQNPLLWERNNAEQLISSHYRIEQMMQDEVEREMTLEMMRNTVKRRLETSREEWIEINDADDVFAQTKRALVPSKLMQYRIYRHPEVKQD